MGSIWWSDPLPSPTSADRTAGSRPGCHRAVVRCWARGRLWSAVTAITRCGLACSIRIRLRRTSTPRRSPNGYPTYSTWTSTAGSYTPVKPVASTLLSSYDTTWSALPSSDGAVSSRGNALMSPLLMTALAAMSRRIGLVSSMHVGLLHPVVVARIGANLDALSNGRWALNIVAGAGGSGELVSDGIDQGDHDERYARASEAMEIVTRLWSGDVIDFRGDFYRVKGVLVGPRPVQRSHPALVSAGASPAGIRLAAKWADWHFIPGRMDAADARARIDQLEHALAEANRPPGSVRSLRHVSTLVRDTPREAEELTEWLLSTVDVTEGLRRYMSGSGGFSETYDAIYQKYGKDEAAVRLVGPVKRRARQPWVTGTGRGGHQGAVRRPDLPGCGPHLPALARGRDPTVYGQRASDPGRAWGSGNRRPSAAGVGSGAGRRDHPPRFSMTGGTPCMPRIRLISPRCPFRCMTRCSVIDSPSVSVRSLSRISRSKSASVSPARYESLAAWTASWYSQKAARSWIRMPRASAVV